MNDLFEVVVDGDLSGGPLISTMHPNASLDKNEAFFSFHGVHAQNYHIFTPAPNRDWAMVWGSQGWIKELPYSNAAYNYNFKSGEPGRLVLEFWITPFDYAPFDGPARAVESKLEEKILGLSCAVLDYDSATRSDCDGFWNLSHKTTMYGSASDLVAFRLMPLDARFRKPVEARWSFQIVDMTRRLVALHDELSGPLAEWRWEFGDGSSSNEQHPTHRYEKPGEYDVRLSVKGPAGSAEWLKIRYTADLAASKLPQLAWEGENPMNRDSHLQVQGQNDRGVSVERFVETNRSRDVKDRFLCSRRAPERSPDLGTNRKALDRVGGQH